MTNRSVLSLLTLFGGTPGALTPSALESTLVFSEISSARDAASLLARLPGVAIFGDWNGNLSRSGERLILRDLTRNVVDEIRYLDDGRWPAEADGGGNKVFHMATTGSTEHQHNHASTTLKVGGSFVATNSGSTYEISFRTKWLAGSNQIHTRLYFDRAAKTTLHDVLADGSNPGAVSSDDLGTWSPATYAGRINNCDELTSTLLIHGSEEIPMDQKYLRVQLTAQP